jgi:hypothetical protein
MTYSLSQISRRFGGEKLMILGCYFYIEVKKSLNRPTGDPDGLKSLRLPDFETIDT